MEFTDKQIKEDEDNAKPMLLIGSRAFEGNLALSSKDWDVVVPYQTLVCWLKYHDTQITWLNLQKGDFPKVTARLTNGQIIELEVVENYASNQMLYEKYLVTEWKQYTSNTFGAGQIKMNMTNNNALLALKYSTCFFPVNWSKNIHQLRNMKKGLGVKSFAKFLEDEDLRHLIELRSRETLARCFSFKTMRTKRIISDVVLKSATYIKRLYEQYATTNENYCIDFPLTGVKLDKTKFSTASDSEKLQLIEEQLLLLETHFASLAMPNATELALEAFVTQSMPDLCSQSLHLNWLLTRTLGVYSKSEYCRAKDRMPMLSRSEEYWKGEGVNYDIDVDYLREKLPSHKAPFASDEEINRSTFRNIAIIWTIDHIDLVSNRSALNVARSALPNLPNDIWRVIASHIDDHVTLSSFEQVSKTFASAVNWQNLLRKCWSDEDLLKVGTEIYVEDWKPAFKKLYEARINTKMYVCQHCFGNHIILSKQEWDAFAAERDNVTEAYGYHCLCPLCVYATGSWSSCSAYPTYGADGEATIGRRCVVQ